MQSDPLRPIQRRPKHGSPMTSIAMMDTRLIRVPLADVPVNAKHGDHGPFDLAPFPIGRGTGEVEALYEAMQWHVRYVGPGGVASFAVSALRIALRDLADLRRGESLRVMAGGAGTTARADRLVDAHGTVRVDHQRDG